MGETLVSSSLFPPFLSDGHSFHESPFSPSYVFLTALMFTPFLPYCSLDCPFKSCFFIDPAKSSMLPSNRRTRCPFLIFQNSALVESLGRKHNRLIPFYSGLFPFEAYSFFFISIDEIPPLSLNSRFVGALPGELSSHQIRKCLPPPLPLPFLPFTLGD